MNTKFELIISKSINKSKVRTFKKQFGNKTVIFLYEKYRNTDRKVSRFLNSKFKIHFPKLFVTSDDMLSLICSLFEKKTNKIGIIVILWALLHNFISSFCESCTLENYFYILKLCFDTQIKWNLLTLRFHWKLQMIVQMQMSLISLIIYGDIIIRKVDENAWNIPRRINLQ